MLTEIGVLTCSIKTEMRLSNNMSSHGGLPELLRVFVAQGKPSVATTLEEALQPAAQADCAVVGITKLGCANIFAQHDGEMAHMIVIPVIHGLRLLDS